MSEQAKGDYAKFLRGIADGLTSVPTPYNLREAEIVREAAAELERLRTEVERLTPREMKWKRGRPTEAGWYWKQYRGSAYSSPVELQQQDLDGRYYVAGVGWLDEYEFAGPLSRPVGREQGSQVVAQGLLRDGGKGGAG